MSFAKKIDNAVIRSFMGLSITDQPYYMQNSFVPYFIESNFIFSALSLTIISWFNDVELSRIFIATGIIISLYRLLIEFFFAYFLAIFIFIIARKKPYKYVLGVSLYSFISLFYLLGFYINFILVRGFMYTSSIINIVSRFRSHLNISKNTAFYTTCLILVVFLHCILTLITNIISIKSRRRPRLR